MIVAYGAFILFLIWGSSKQFNWLGWFDWLGWILIFLILVTIICGAYLLISYLIKTTWNIVKDFRLLKQLNLGNELTWVAVCQTTNRFRSDWGQSRYLEMLRTQKIQIIDLDEIAPSLSLVGVNAKVAMARLKEQIYDLQE